MCESDLYRVLIELVLVAAYSGLEYWLGRTKRTEAASLIELLIKVITRKKGI